MLKKILIAFGILIGLLVAAAIIVPLVVDVDKYRPQIVTAANEKINGKLELGKLSLSLWGQIRIEVAGLTLTDPKGQKVVTVNDAFFHLPFASVLSGSPKLEFNMKRPTVIVIKNKDGKMNVMSLMKPSAVTSAPGNPASPPSTSGSSSVQIPGLLARARLGIILKDALINYKDELTQFETQVKDLNVVLKDISLTHETEMEVWADLDMKLGKTFTLHGPARIKGTAKPELANGHFDHVTIRANADLDSVEMASPGMFEKKKGVPAHADLSIVASQKSAQIEHINAQFVNAEITSSGSITSLDAVAPASPAVVYHVKSNDIDFKPWAELIPMLKEYNLGGSAKFTADVNGPSDKLGYKALFEVKALTAKAPKLKAEPRIDATVSIVTDQIDRLIMTMKAPGNELTVSGKLVSFTNPHGEFQVTSSGMDLDQLIEFPPPGAKKTAAPATGGTPAPGSATGGAPAPGAENYDAMLAPLRESKIAAASEILIGVNIKMMKAYEVKMTDLVGKMTLRNLVAGIEGFSMGVWAGNIKAAMSFNLATQAPTYHFNSIVDHLDLAQAVASQFHFLKNTVIGKAHFDILGDGVSFNPTPAMTNLKAKGTFKVEKATFATIDVAKMVSEALNKAVDKVGDKIPQVKGKKLGMPAGRESRYDFISSDYVISGGKFVAPNFVAKAETGQGIDLKGAVDVGMIDYALKTNWEVIDTYNLTSAKDLSVEQNGVKVDHILAEGNGPVKFPISAGCNAMAPCYSYTEVPEFLAKVALNNVTSALTGHAKSELQKKVQSIIPKAPPAIQNQIDDFSKKLFH